MEIKMNKEIRDYQESLFFGLNFRQCLCSVLAIIAAAGIYFGVRDTAGEDFTSWLCMLGAAPFAVCGFFKYHGMTAEKFLWAVIKSEILYPKRLLFQPESLYYACLEEVVQIGERTRLNGAEVKKKKEDRKQEKLARKERKKLKKGMRKHSIDRTDKKRRKKRRDAFD